MMTFLAVEYADSWRVNVQKGVMTSRTRKMTEYSWTSNAAPYPSSSINHQKHLFQNALLLLGSQHCSWKPAINQQVDIFSKKNTKYSIQTEVAQIEIIQSQVGQTSKCILKSSCRKWICLKAESVQSFAKWGVILIALMHSNAISTLCFWRQAVFFQINKVKACSHFMFESL